MAATTFQKLIQNISGTKSVQNLLENFQKLNDEIKKKETELKKAFDHQKEEKVEMAWKKYQEIVKVLGNSETKLEKEVNSTIAKIKKSADELEKNIAAYKKKAIAQKASFEKSLFNKTMTKTSKKKATTTKKAAAPAAATAKKATKKVAKKATKKASK